MPTESQRIDMPRGDTDRTGGPTRPPTPPPPPPASSSEITTRETAPLAIVDGRLHGVSTIPVTPRLAASVMLVRSAAGRAGDSLPPSQPDARLPRRLLGLSPADESTRTTPTPSPRTTRPRQRGARRFARRRRRRASRCRRSRWRSPSTGRPRRSARSASPPGSSSRRRRRTASRSTAARFTRTSGCARPTRSRGSGPARSSSRRPPSR